MKPIDQIKSDLESNCGISVTLEGNILIVPVEKIRDVSQYLKESSDYRMDYLASLTGIDCKDSLGVVYNLYSMEKKESGITIKVKTDREKSVVPSVTPIWRGAEYQEREAYDLLGIKFEGHPDLRRILMWDEFEFHPLRKDYVMEDQDRAL